MGTKFLRYKVANCNTWEKVENQLGMVKKILQLACQDLFTLSWITDVAMIVVNIFTTAKRGQQASDGNGVKYYLNRKLKKVPYWRCA